MSMSRRLLQSLLLLKPLPRPGRDAASQAFSSSRCLRCSPGSSTSDHSNRGAFNDSSKESSPLAKLERSFQLLGMIKDGCTVEQIRKAYIDLVKQYHPDSRSPHASAERFAEIQDAYKRCMSYAKNVAMSREIYAALEEELADIDQRLGFTKQRQLPHRQFLTYDVGPGTFSQRQKAYAQHRLYEAMDNIYEKQFEKALQNPDAKEVTEFRGKPKKYKMSITQTLERIAHEKIRDSMGRGEFKNLRGMGKPLHLEHDNPVIDDMQQKLNRLLTNAGFAPEWISLDKEIRHSIEKVRKQLSTCWSRCGPDPMSPEKKKEWENELEELSQAVKLINKKIDNLNLIVPSLTAQRAHIRMELMVSRVMATPPGAKDCELRHTLSAEQGTTKTADSATKVQLQQVEQHPNAHFSLHNLVRMFIAWCESWWSKQ